jgi:type II secretory pathway component PulM
VGSIAEKLADALSMWWQALDERERQLVLVGAAYLVALAVWTPLERRRKARERDEFAAAVARHLTASGGGRG